MITGIICVRNPSMVARPVNFGMRGPSNVTSSAKDTLDRSFVAKQSKYASTAATFCSRDGMPSPDFYIFAERNALCQYRHNEDESASLRLAGRNRRSTK